MSEPVRLTLDEAERLAFDALRANGTLESAARATARALVAAEADGQAGHGLSRVPSYALQARSGGFFDELSTHAPGGSRFPFAPA